MGNPENENSPLSVFFPARFQGAYGGADFYPFLKKNKETAQPPALIRPSVVFSQRTLGEGWDEGGKKGFDFQRIPCDIDQFEQFYRKKKFVWK